MKPGELVKLCDESGLDENVLILVGNMSTSDERWYAKAGSRFVAGNLIDHLAIRLQGCGDILLAHANARIDHGNAQRAILKEIAAHLNLPERTVRTHLLRGLRALKESVRDLK